MQNHMNLEGTSNRNPSNRKSSLMRSHEAADLSIDYGVRSTGVVRERRVGLVHEPVTDLKLLDHGGHAHLVLLREAVHVAQHALVHAAPPPPPRKKRSQGFGDSERKGPAERRRAREIYYLHWAGVLWASHVKPSIDKQPNFVRFQVYSRCEFWQKFWEKSHRLQHVRFIWVSGEKNSCTILM